MQRKELSKSFQGLDKDYLRIWILFSNLCIPVKELNIDYLVFYILICLQLLLNILIYWLCAISKVLQNGHRYSKYLSIHLVIFLNFIREMRRFRIKMRLFIGSRSSSTKRLRFLHRQTPDTQEREATIIS